MRTGQTLPQDKGILRANRQDQGKGRGKAGDCGANHRQGQSDLWRWGTQARPR